MEAYNPKELLKEIEKSFNREIETKIESFFSSFVSKEFSLLKYLKNDLFDNFDEVKPSLVDFNPNLYSYAKEFIKQSEEGFHNPLGDYPLCDALEGIYKDYSTLCGEIGEELGYNDNVDLSNLDGLQNTLAGLAVFRVLDYYKDIVEEVQPKYEQVHSYFNLLAEWQSGDLKDEEMPDYESCLPEFSFEKDENNSINLDSIKLTDESKQRFKDFLENETKNKNDDGWNGFEYSYLSELFEEEQIKEELTKKSTNKRKVKWNTYQKLEKSLNL